MRFQLVCFYCNIFFASAISLDILNQLVEGSSACRAMTRLSLSQLSLKTSFRLRTACRIVRIRPRSFCVEGETMRLSRCALIVLSLSLCASFSLASDLYSLDSHGVSDGTIYKLNQSTGAETLVGPVGAAFGFP